MEITRHLCKKNTSLFCDSTRYREKSKYQLIVKIHFNTIKTLKIYTKKVNMRFYEITTILLVANIY